VYDNVESVRGRGQRERKDEDSRSMPGEEYYIISDLHIGGDAELDICEFEAELTAFLRELEKKDGKTELIIAGDAFGFWELTEVEGPEKLKVIASNHRELFEQFRRTGERVQITLIPGNHDYELACYPEFGDVLREYNIRLEPKEYITRTIGGEKVWIEHGSQRDPFNRILHFGERYVTPIGYFITRHIVSNAGKHAVFAKQKWLGDIEAVQPNEQIPHWILSNYFYREMSPILRYGMLPFLMLFGVSIFWYFAALLEKYGIIGTKIFTVNFLESFGILGDIPAIIFTVNSAAIAALLLFSIPFVLVLRDVKKTLGRYGLKTPSSLRVQKKEVYLAAAKEIFASDPEVRVFVFGHTHNAFVERVDGRLVINTGTWLKKLTRVPAHFKWLPDVYVPSFRLNYFRIYGEGGGIVVEYERIPKEVDHELTLVQRLMIFGKRGGDTAEIPERIVLDSGAEAGG